MAILYSSQIDDWYEGISLAVSQVQQGTVAIDGGKYGTTVTYKRFNNLLQNMDNAVKSSSFLSLADLNSVDVAVNDIIKDSDKEKVNNNVLSLLRTCII